VGRKEYPTPLQVERQATPSQPRLLTRLQHHLLPHGRGLAWRSARAAGTIFQPRLPLHQVARDSFAHHLARGVP
jgi:hypothetical protein